MNKIKDNASVLNSLMLAVCIGLLSWIANRTQEMTVEVAVMKSNMKERWTSMHQMIWASRLASKNAGLVIPDPQAVVEGKAE